MLTTKNHKRKKRTIGLFPAHPSQVWILRQLEISLKNEYHFLWFIRDKDISIQLADGLSIRYSVISRAKKGLLGNASEMITNIFKLFSLTRKHKIDMWISKYSAAHIVSRFLGRKSIFFVDDDFNLVPILYILSCPFADAILLPRVTGSGPYRRKLTKLNSLFELIYLHPDRFIAQSSIYSYLGIAETQKYAIVRLASLTAHHDTGVKGVSEELLNSVIELSEKNSIKVFITSEKPIASKFERYRLAIPPIKIHHALFFAEFLMGDSQTMTSEAALLGTPAFRINSFVGRIKCIADLEKKGLAFGFKPGKEGEQRLISELKAFLATGMEGLRNSRKDTVLQDYDDPLDTFINAIRALF